MGVCDGTFIVGGEIPQSKVEDCILPDAIKTTFQEYVNRKEIPTYYYRVVQALAKLQLQKPM